MTQLSQIFSLIFLALLLVLVIALIVLVINAIKTLNKVDHLVDDISKKSTTLNGVFSVIDIITDAVVGFSDSIVGMFSGLAIKFMKRKKGKNE